MHDIVDKTLSFVFEHTDYKTIGVGRTDAKVSSRNYPLQLFINETVDEKLFIEKFNQNAANDLKAISIISSSTEFNIISTPKIKTYHYYFSFGQKQDPYLAPLMTGFTENLDIKLMQKAAKLFEGTHYFHKYCSQPTEKTIFERKIDFCSLKKNTFLEGNYFPEESYVLEIKGKGFLRYQIRYIMAVLYHLGKGEISFSEIEQSLSAENDKKPWKFIAPSSGLQLYDVTFL